MAVRTAKQRIALQKAQAASARKRKGHGKGKRIAKRVAVGAAVVAAGVGAGVAVHQSRKSSKSQLRKRLHDPKQKPHGKNVTVYHHTNSTNAASIKKHGLKGSKAHDNRAYVTDKPLRGSRYGGHVVKTTVKHKDLRPDVIHDHKTGSRYYSIHEGKITHKVVDHKIQRKRAQVSKTPSYLTKARPR